MAASADPAQLSPKFTAPLIIGIIVFAAAGALSLVTVEHFNWAGQWAGILHAFVTLTAMAATAYYKADPLRANFAANVAAEKALQAQIAEPQQVPENVIVVEPGQPVPYIPPASNKG